MIDQRDLQLQHRQQGAGTLALPGCRRNLVGVCLLVEWVPLETVKLHVFWEATRATLASDMLLDTLRPQLLLEMLRALTSFWTLGSCYVVALKVIATTGSCCHYPGKYRVLL